MGDCHFCGPTDRQLRPYGPGGSRVCFPCATATPERERATRAAFVALLTANEVLGDGVTVLTPDGPQPFDVTEVDRG